MKRDLRDRRSAEVAPLLEPDEQVQAISWGQIIRPTFGAYASLRILLSRESAYRAVVATDRRILVCRGDRLRRRVLPVALAELPRTTRLGPGRSLMFGLWRRIELAGEPIYVNRRFDETGQADASPDSPRR